MSGDICPSLCALPCGAQLLSFMIMETEGKHSMQMQTFSKLNAAAVVVLENLFSLTSDKQIWSFKYPQCFLILTVGNTLDTEGS